MAYNFYELRSMKADEVGMDEIWTASRYGRHGSFVSMCPGEASNRTPSDSMWGFTPQQSLMLDWANIADVHEAEEGARACKFYRIARSMNT